MFAINESATEIPNQAKSETNNAEATPAATAGALVLDATHPICACHAQSMTTPSVTHGFSLINSPA